MPQSFNNVSENMIDKNELEQSEVQDSICPQQTINKEENCSAVVPIENVEVPSRIN